MPTLFLYSITDTENLSPDLGPSASGIRLALYMPGSPKAGSLLETALARAALSFWGCRVASHAYVSDKRLRRESGDMIRSAVSSVREAAELAGFPFDPSLSPVLLSASMIPPGSGSARLYADTRREVRGPWGSSAQIADFEARLDEDYDVFVFDSDTPDARRLIGAINVKNAGSHDHEKTVDVLKQKLDRFHQAAGSDVRMRIAYVDVRPGDIHTEYHPGMGGLPVDVCSTGMFRAEDAEKDVTMGQIVRDAEDALHLLERFFGGKEDA